ncbi:MAG TPA: D-alanyl-D-alanine carboxypeptidase/D-alanyl-D-alanine-endopeptidase [Pyrinomonadaceae bacterium]|jgi:D-alanyl-D-alanine carboxypeptidase/D-alanyl-D-alanine-endopeptidase (penicillin-binding protein 4)
MKFLFKEKSVFCLAFLFLAFNFVPLTSAQETTAPPLRERIAPAQTPTPKPLPTITATPAASPIATPTSQRVQSLPELQSQIRSVLLRPQLLRAQVGVKVLSLDSGKTVFEQNAEKYFMPASNMKNFTVAAALDRLSPNFRFTTSVYAAAQPDSNGTIRSDLIIYGRGNPLISTVPQDGSTVSSLDELAAKIAASGVRRIEGNLIGDESYFSGDPVQVSWEWDDLQWESGAEVSALSINDNLVKLQIAPGANTGAPCIVTITPPNQLFTVINLTQTTSAGTKQELEVHKRLGTNVLEIRGTMPLGGRVWSNEITVAKPAEMFVALLKNALAQKGVIVTGQTRTADAKARKLAPIDLTKMIEIARHDSPILSIIAAKTMKPSQNTYTEIILRTLGEVVGDKSDPKQTSSQRGATVVQKFLAEAGIAPESLVIWDGSGLSRHNLITPNAAAQLYAFMNRHRYASSWRESLTIAGVDGTLQNRFKNTFAAGNVRGKTGTIDQVSALSGYLTTAAGEQLAFSVIVNALPAGSAASRAVIDEIVLALANFNGKTN